MASKAAKKAGSGLFKVVKFSPELAKVVGHSEGPRVDATKAVWAYVKKHDLQEAKDRRNFQTDSTLKEIFDDKPTVSMLEVQKYLNKHIVAPPAAKKD